MSHTVTQCTDRADFLYSQLREEKWARGEIGQIGLTLIMYAMGETTSKAVEAHLGFGTPESAEA